MPAHNATDCQAVRTWGLRKPMRDRLASVGPPRWGDTASTTRHTTEVITTAASASAAAPPAPGRAGPGASPWAPPPSSAVPPGCVPGGVRCSSSPARRTPALLEVTVRTAPEAR
jgi:hypothetical protein